MLITPEQIRAARFGIYGSYDGLNGNGSNNWFSVMSGTGESAALSNGTVQLWGNNQNANVTGSNDSLYAFGSNDTFGGSVIGYSSGITETITSNPDGSWVDHLLDTGNQFNWSEEQLIHAANNALAEETINYDNGWHSVSYFDPYNQFTWAEETLTYDSQGKPASWFYDKQAAEVITNHDGTQVYIFYGV